MQNKRKGISERRQGQGGSGGCGGGGGGGDGRGQYVSYKKVQETEPF